MKEILVPDIGDFKDIDVIEVLIKPGDTVTAEQSLITVESDKATMEIPSPSDGVVRELKIKVGDKVSQGTLIALMEAGEAGSQAKPEAPRAEAKTAPTDTKSEAKSKAEPAEKSAKSQGDSYSTPASTDAADGAATAKASERAPAASGAAAPVDKPEPRAVASGESTSEPASDSADTKPHASPSVRKFARELGVDLSKLSGSGPKGRILQEDVQGFVKAALTGTQGSAPQATGGGLPFTLLPWPDVDFAKFGPVETKPLSRIKRVSGANLHRNWVSIPHITQFDEADITELEAFRRASAADADKQGLKLTLLAFLIKACVTALRKFPNFNASLDKSGENLVLKNYFHIGVAVDTPDGLVVPVIRDADKKGVFDLARELGEVSKQARDKKLKPGDMQGGTFSISSLGGIGGTSFTPIINAPEVAILGVSKSVMRPVFRDGEFVPRLILPLSLSYDHRVIDGADGARFTSYLASVLSDIRRSLL